jgi:hypothetical protein
MIVRKLSYLCAAGVLTCAQSARAQDGPLGFVSKLGTDVDVRSGARIIADELANGGTVLLPDNASGGGGGSTVPQIQLRGGNRQVNDASKTFVQIFPGFRPFVRATQSEVSTVGGCEPRQPLCARRVVRVPSGNVTRM